MMLAQQNADHSGAVLNAESCFGADESGFFKGKQFCSRALSLSLTRPPHCLEDFSASWPTNKLRSCQTIFLSWMPCFHQNKMLIGELNLFSREE